MMCLHPGLHETAAPYTLPENGVDINCETITTVCVVALVTPLPGSC